MSKSRLAAFVALLVLLLWWGWPSPEATDMLPSTASSPMAETPKPSQIVSQVVSQAATVPASTDNLPLAEEDDAATQYAAELRYPPYAQPYQQPRHPADETLYTPVTLEQQDGSQWSLALQKYRFYQPEPLVFEVSFPNELALSSLNFTVSSQGDERELQRFTVDAKTGQHQVQLKAQPDWPEELFLRVSSGHGHSIRAPFEWVRPVATVTAIGQATVRGEDLQIPLQLNTEEAGLYQIQALLLAQGQVIARLVETQTLGEGDVKAQLRVHGSVLPTQAQPLSLTALRLQRMSPAPDKPPRFGRSLVDIADLGDFGQADVSFQPYQPTDEELKRLQFLRGQ